MSYDGPEASLMLVEKDCPHRDCLGSIARATDMFPLHDSIRISTCSWVVLAMVPFSDRFYYSGSMKTRTWPVRSGFVQNGSLN
jgi:hypothetical protein